MPCCSHASAFLLYVSVSKRRKRLLLQLARCACSRTTSVAAQHYILIACSRGVPFKCEVHRSRHVRSCGQAGSLGAHHPLQLHQRQSQVLGSVLGRPPRLLRHCGLRARRYRYRLGFAAAAFGAHDVALGHLPDTEQLKNS